MIPVADSKDLAKKRHAKNCNNMEGATLIIIVWNIITNPYNINKEWSNHNPQIQLTVISSLVHPAAFGKMNCIQIKQLRNQVPKIQSMQQQPTMVSMVTSSIHSSAFGMKNWLELKQQHNWTAVHQLSLFLPRLWKGLIMRPQSTIPQLYQFEIKQLPNQLCNHLSQISIIATNL